MDREWLATELAKGRSIEALAREVGRHPSTVAYWVRQHGVESSHARRHAAKGALDRDELVVLIADGMSIRAMAQELGVSYTTVRHWLKKYGLTTPRAQRLAVSRDARDEEAAGFEGVCEAHGEVPFVRRGAGFRCQRCRAEAVTARRRRVKAVLVAEAGGRCQECGYDANPTALHFHHLDRATKSFTLAHVGVTLSLERARAEAAKCVLLCANCHAEVEAGVRELRFSGS